MGARGYARIRPFPGRDRAAERFRYRRVDPVVVRALQACSSLLDAAACSKVKKSVMAVTLPTGVGSYDH